MRYTNRPKVLDSYSCATAGLSGRAEARRAICATARRGKPAVAQEKANA